MTSENTVRLREQFDNLAPAVNALVKRLHQGALAVWGRPVGGQREDGRGQVAAAKWKVRTMLPPSRREALVSDYQAGVSVTELAYKYQVHRDTVRRCLDGSQVVRRRRSLTAERQARAVELYRSGRTLAEVAEVIGTSKKTVLRVLDDLGIPRRPAARRRASLDSNRPTTEASAGVS